MHWSCRSGTKKQQKSVFTPWGFVALCLSKEPLQLGDFMWRVVNLRVVVFFFLQVRISVEQRRASPRPPPKSGLLRPRSTCSSRTATRSPRSTNNWKHVGVVLFVMAARGYYQRKLGTPVPKRYANTTYELDSTRTLLLFLRLFSRLFCVS